MSTQSKKPAILLTTFWDAEMIVRNGAFLSPDGSLHEVRQENVCSISLASPELDGLERPKRLSFFCPTYDILLEYEANGSWDQYASAYKDLLDSREREIEEWIESLTSAIYILCCWENTNANFKCHRSVVFDMLKSLEHVQTIYRHGHESRRRVMSSVEKDKRRIASQPYVNMAALANNLQGAVEQLEFSSIRRMLDHIPNRESSTYYSAPVYQSYTTTESVTDAPTFFDMSIYPTISLSNASSYFVSFNVDTNEPNDNENIIDY